MRVVVVGAGRVGQTAVESLHEAHRCTVIDFDAERLQALSHAFDVRVVEGNGAGREALQEAGIADAELVLACTSRDEANLVTAMLARRLSRARTVVRTTNMDYLQAWREGDLDVDFMVSSELETASAIARVVGMPGTRQADFFVRGEVQVFAFDASRAAPPAFCGKPLDEAGLPRESRVVTIVRDGRRVLPGPHEAIQPGDRVIVVASRASAREWSRLLVRGDRVVNDVAIFGGGRIGATIARVLLNRGIRVRLVEADRRRADRLAEALPGARVYHATGLDPEFLRRERIGRATAAVMAMSDHGRNLFGAVLAKVHGVPTTIVVLEQPASAAEVFDAGGVDATIDPGVETAQVMVRFAHDPRTSQIAMFEDDRLEVLDITVRPDSALAHRPLDELPRTTSVIGAMVRDGRLLFPGREQELQAGDRVIVLVDRERAGAVERAL
jgi:trk system potassium uptake protein TrkA